jgi:hypothetical protein
VPAPWPLAGQLQEQLFPGSRGPCISAFFPDPIGRGGGQIFRQSTSTVLQLLRSSGRATGGERTRRPRGGCARASASRLGKRHAAFCFESSWRYPIFCHAACLMQSLVDASQNATMEVQDTEAYTRSAASHDLHAKQN